MGIKKSKLKSFISNSKIIEGNIIAITIQPSPNYWSFTRNIGDKHIQQAMNSSSKEEATHLDIFSKIKDWFCGIKTDEVLALLYDLTHTSDNQSDIESSL
ncbi:MAG: hypothetical protein AB8W37_04985 [Arsenophonus endosymbiont of Dermacentor nuttalli]